MKGRTPKPIQQLKAAGTFRKDRHGAPLVSPELTEGVPDPPANLPESCRADWFRVCGLLHENGILTNCDLDAVSRYCFLLDVERGAQAEIQKHGSTVKSETKYGKTSKPNPAFRVLMETAKELRALGERLGFDPYSRQRLKLSLGGNKPEPVSKILEMMKGRRS